MKKNRLLENLNQEIGANIPMRRYSLADMVSESYKAIYDCKDGSNLKKLAESHLADVKQNPRDIERLSRQLCIIKEMKHLVESNELKDEDLVDKKKYDTVEPNEDRVIVQNECNESAEPGSPSDKVEQYIRDLAKKNPDYWLEDLDPNNEAGEAAMNGADFDEIGDIYAETAVYNVLGSAGGNNYQEYENALSRAKKVINQLNDMYESKKMRESAHNRRSRRRMNEDATTPSTLERRSKSSNNSVGSYRKPGEATTPATLERRAKDIKEADDPELTEEEAKELAKHLKTIRKDKKMTEKANPDMPKRRGIKCHIADSKKEDLDEADIADRRVRQLGVDVFCPEDKMSEVQYAVEDAIRRVGPECSVSGIQWGDTSWSAEEYGIKESKKVNESYADDKMSIQDMRDIVERLEELINELEAQDIDSVPLATSTYGIYPPFIGTHSGYLGLSEGDIQKYLGGEDEYYESKKSRGKRIKESKSYRGLQNFKKQSESKAFYKTFKKMHESLKEGKALTRQESIDLYKAANSALTQMSIELEHNPKFLKTFNEASTLLSADVNSLRESLARGKAPSKDTMKSLAKFSEALLCEVSEEVLTSRALDYMYGEDRKEKDSEYSDEEKEKAINYYLEKTEPAPKLHEAEDAEIKKNSTVEILRGSEKGKTGKVTDIQSNDEEDKSELGEYTYEVTTSDGRKQYLSASDLKASINEADEEDEDLDDIEAPEDDFVGDDEGDVQSEEADAFDQEYADARVALHKELAEKHADDPDVQDKIAQDAEEVLSLPGITDEQIAELNGETPSEEGSEEEDIPDDEEPEEEPEEDGEITDDELEELKRHLKEMRSAKKGN